MGRGSENAREIDLTPITRLSIPDSLIEEETAAARRLRIDQWLDELAREEHWPLDTPALQALLDRREAQELLSLKGFDQARQQLAVEIVRRLYSDADGEERLAVTARNYALQAGALSPVSGMLITHREEGGRFTIHLADPAAHAQSALPLPLCGASFPDSERLPGYRGSFALARFACRCRECFDALRYKGYSGTHPLALAASEDGDWTEERIAQLFALEEKLALLIQGEIEGSSGGPEQLTAERLRAKADQLIVEMAAETFYKLPPGTRIDRLFGPPPIAASQITAADFPSQYERSQMVIDALAEAIREAVGEDPFPWPSKADYQKLVAESSYLGQAPYPARARSELLIRFAARQCPQALRIFLNHERASSNPEMTIALRSARLHAPSGELE